MSTKYSDTTLVVVIMIILVIIIVVCFSLMTKIEGRVEEPTKPELEPVIEAIDQNLVIIREVFVPNTNKWMYRISKVEFEGHTYIVLEDHGTCLLHDPDCKCQNPK